MAYVIRNAAGDVLVVDADPETPLPDVEGAALVEVADLAVFATPDSRFTVADDGIVTAVPVVQPDPDPDPIAEADTAFYEAMAPDANDPDAVATIKASVRTWMTSRPGIAVDA